MSAQRGLHTGIAIYIGAKFPDFRYRARRTIVRTQARCWKEGDSEMARRTRLVEQILDLPARNWIVEAGAGYGKSALVNELRRSLATPLLLVRGPSSSNDLPRLLVELSDAARRARVPEASEGLSAAAESPERLAAALVKGRCSVAIDDVHLWHNEVGSFLRDLGIAVEEDSTSMVLLVGRDLPASLASTRSNPAWGYIDAADLAFTASETAEVLRAAQVDDRDTAAAVHRLSSGWPVSVASMAARLRQHPHQIQAQLACYETVVDAHVHGLLDGVDDADLAAGRSLALLPFFDDHITALAGAPGLIERLAAAGIPVTRQADGWTEFPEQFRASFIRTQPSLPHQPSTSGVPPGIIDRFVQRGEINAAVISCLAVGDNLGAATVIANVTYTQEPLLDPVALNAAMTTIGNVAEDVPRSLLVQAQVNVSHGAFDEGLVCIERAAACTGRTDPGLIDPVHREILLELGVWRHFSGQRDEAKALMLRCQAALGEGITGATDANRARLLDLQGLLRAADGTEAGLDAARVHLIDALAIWRRLQEPRAAAVTVLRLVTDVLVDLGRRQEALALLDSLPAIGPVTLVNRARVHLHRSRLLPFVGRDSEIDEALAQTRKVADLIGHDWLLGMAACFDAVAASLRDDHDRVIEMYEEVAAHPNRFVTTADQGVAWTLLADSLIRCHNFELAEHALARASECEGLNTQLYDFAQVALAAHVGDPAHARVLLDDLAVRTREIPERRWAIELLSALCCWRSGDSEAMAQHLKACFDAATDLGQPTLPLIAEQRLLDMMSTEAQPQNRPLANGALAPPVGLTDVIEVTIFDGFQVTINGHAAALPVGQITDLVKLLVLSNGRLVVDQVVDRLWPDADLALGRQRLRNVLKRIRKVSEQLVDRSGSALVLASGVDSDYARALVAAGTAFGSAASLIDVSEAVRLNARSLLADDLYTDWAEEARSEHRRRLIKLLDKQADLAEQAGDIALAVSALEAADEVDGLRAGRIDYACSLLRRVGRDAAADGLASRQATATPASGAIG